MWPGGGWKGDGVGDGCWVVVVIHSVICVVGAGCVVGGWM